MKIEDQVLKLRSLAEVSLRETGEFTPTITILESDAAPVSIAIRQFSDESDKLVAFTEAASIVFTTTTKLVAFMFDGYVHKNGIETNKEAITVIICSGRGASSCVYPYTTDEDGKLVEFGDELKENVDKYDEFVVNTLTTFMNYTKHTSLYNSVTKALISHGHTISTIEDMYNEPSEVTA